MLYRLKGFGILLLYFPLQIISGILYSISDSLFEMGELLNNKFLKRISYGFSPVKLDAVIDKLKWRNRDMCWGLQLKRMAKDSREGDYWSVSPKPVTKRSVSLKPVTKKKVISKGTFS